VFLCDTGPIVLGVLLHIISRFYSWFRKLSTLFPQILRYLFQCLLCRILLEFRRQAFLLIKANFSLRSCLALLNDLVWIDLCLWPFICSIDSFIYFVRTPRFAERIARFRSMVLLIFLRQNIN
jgi:hypothetical protein